MIKFTDFLTWTEKLLNGLDLGETYKKGLALIMDTLSFSLIEFKGSLKLWHDNLEVLWKDIRLLFTGSKAFSISQNILSYIRTIIINEENEQTSGEKDRELQG